MTIYYVIMKKVCCLILVFVIGAWNLVNSQSSYDGNVKNYTSVSLKKDFTLLRKALEEAHPELYRFTPKASMDSSFESIHNTIYKDMNELEFYRLISPVFSKIKCGHTRLAPPDGLIRHIVEKGNVFPFDIKIMDGKIYVWRNFSADASVVKGTEIVSINKIPVSRILEAMMPFAFADGDVKTIKHRIIEKEFFLFYILAIGEPDTFEMKVIHPVTRKEDKLICKAVPISTHKRSQIPLLDFTFSLADKQTAIVKVKTFNPDWYNRSGIDFYKWIDSVFLIIKAKNTKKLIIDLRGNGGGNPELVTHLYKQVADSAFNVLNYPEFKTKQRFDYFGDTMDTTNFFKLVLNPKGTYTWKDEGNDWYGRYQPDEKSYLGRVYLLMDGESFSSTGFFGAVFRYNQRGKIIGEESGGSCRCNDCHGTLVLPGTGLRIEIARCAVNVNLNGQNCEAHGIIPDIPVEQTVSDFIKDKDTVLEYALKIQD